MGLAADPQVLRLFPMAHAPSLRSVLTG